MRYVRALDGLRAYAVGFVILAHMPPVQGVPATFLLSDLASGLRLGYLGVDIFFVLSGFLITSILLADKERGRFSFARFYAKRTLRIFPIFYLAILFCALVFALPRTEVLANALYVSNYFYVFDRGSSPLRHTWSLAVEEQFYLIWPLAVFLIPSRHMGRALIFGVPLVVLGSLLASYFLVDVENYGRFVVRGTMFRILSLGAGALLAVYSSRIMEIRFSWIVVACLVALMGRGASLFLHDYARAVVGLLSMSLLATSLFCAAYVGSQHRVAIARWLLESAPVVYLGKISYGVYLYHYVVLHALNARYTYNPDGVTWTTLLLFLVLSIAVPAVSFRFIESPLLRLKEHFNEPR